MNERDQKVLESYLNTLDKSLSQLSTSDRAEIITEIKGHVLDTLEREDQRTVDNVLASLGEAETVANKYLMERGLSLGKPSKTPVVKWLTIGFLGTVAMCLLFAALTMVFFSPLIEIDDSAGRIRILGGLIDISDSKTKVEMSRSSHTSLSGSIDTSAGASQKIMTMTPEMKFRLIFSNGKIEISNSNSETLSWDCKLDESVEPLVTNSDGLITLDMSQTKGAKCEVSVPPMKELSVEGINGKIDYIYPRVDSSIKLTSGKIDIEFDDNVQYNHQIHVLKGMMTGLPETNADGIKFNIDLVNGVVEGN